MCDAGAKAFYIRKTLLVNWMIESIKKLGLNEYESRAYRALLSAGRSSAVGISKKAVIPRARVYDVLFSLERKGFALKSISKPVEFSALRPTHAVAALARQRREQLDSSIGEIEAIAKALEKNASDGREEFSESAAIVEGRKNIYSLIDEGISKCSESVVLSSSKEGLSRKREFFSERLAQAGRRGVEVREVKSDNSRLVVFDRDCVLLFLNDGKSGENSEKALLVKSPFLAGGFLSALARESEESEK